MPLLIAVLALVAVAIAYQMKLFSPQQPEIETTQEDMLKSDIQRSVESMTRALSSGNTVTAAQDAEIKKFSAIATMAGTATAVSVAAFSPLTLAAAGPIGAAVAGVIVAFSFLRGTAHLVANEWVQKVQNPFDQAMFAIVGGIDASIANKTATKRSVLLGKQALTNLWANYRYTAERFAAEDRDHRLVIDQSYCWYIAQCGIAKGSPDPRFPQGFLNHVLADLDRKAAALP